MTSLIGICVIDSWKLADYHKLINRTRVKEEKQMTITRFAGTLGWQLLTNAPSIAAGYLGSECTSSPPSLTVTMNSILQLHPPMKSLLNLFGPS
jgi:hypothetical protein